MVAEGAVIAGEAEVEAGGGEVGDTGCQSGGAHAVAQRDFLSGRRGAVVVAVAAAEIFLAERQERRLSDAAGHHDQVLNRLRRKAVAQRAPDVELVARIALGESAS